MKTLKNSWNKPLSQFLKTSLKPALIGLGQELRGDDAAGILAVRRLEQAFADAQTAAGADSNKKARMPAPFLFDAGPYPEASAGPLRRFGPDRVVFLDAAEMGAAPGTIGWIDAERIGDPSPSTHTFPMQGFSRYLEQELGCRVAVLGIQPRQLEFDSSASEEVLLAIEEITRAILSAMTNPATD